MIITLVLSMLLSAQAATVGKVFKKGDAKNQILTYERTDSMADGVTTAIAEYKNPDGSVALKEITVYDDNLNFTSYTLEHKQLNYEGVVKKQKNKVSFDLKKGSNKKGTETEKQDSPVMVGALLSLYIQKNWDLLKAGKTVDFRLAVVDRQETIGFEFEKVDSKKFNGKTYTTIKMSPSSWLISKMVDDIYFMFDENKKLKVYEGRLTAKIKAGGEWKDLDATVFY